MSLVALVATSLCSTAAAQQPPSGAAVNRFNPSERGSEWFALDTLDLRGDIRPAIGVVGEYAGSPVVVYGSGGTGKTKLVSEQFFLHAGASLVLLDSLRVAFNLPIALLSNGTSATGAAGEPLAAPSHSSLGDARVSLDIRLLGRFATPFTLALGGQLFVPTGESRQYTGDDLAHGIVHLAAAGELGIFSYGLKAGYHVRALRSTLNGAAYGNEFIYGVSAGLRLADRKLLIGPELFGATVVNPLDGPLGKTPLPLEVIFGGHYTIGTDWRIGAGAGPGITYDIGSPQFRILGSIEWAPAYKPPPPPVMDRDHDGIPDNVDACPDVPGVRSDDPAKNGCPADRDGDGIYDKDDACPDVPGIRTADPKTNGCPAPVAPSDRDGDGIIDSEDACPDVKGVRTNDPKTNGCPPPPSDRDLDGIFDTEDACPDVPGVRTADPKTNGCPPNPDRDGDGIKNEDDACPDEPGPPDPDPKKNGCPKAVIVAGQIKIIEQVKFASASAVILPASDSVLAAVVSILKAHPEIKKVRVEGHTDNLGPAAYNKTLSTQRAASVAKWLTTHGIEAARITSAGFGLEKPIDTNATPAGRTNNRRVEFHIDDEKQP